MQIDPATLRRLKLPVLISLRAIAFSQDKLARLYHTAWTNDPDQARALFAASFKLTEARETLIRLRADLRSLSDLTPETEGKESLVEEKESTLEACELLTLLEKAQEVAERIDNNHHLGNDFAKSIHQLAAQVRTEITRTEGNN